MLYEDIRKGCKRYHQRYADYDHAYDKFFKEKCQPKWDNPDALTESEVEKLIEFLDEFSAWGPFMKGKPTQSTLLTSLRMTLQALNHLRYKTILDLALSDRIVQSNHMSSEQFSMYKTILCFDELAECGGGNNSTAASKILHVVNPSLFMMWDSKIRKCYKVSGKGVGRQYVDIFITEIRRIANKAVEQVAEHENLSRDAAIESFTDHCKYSNSLAKIIDEYNFVISR